MSNKRAGSVRGSSAMGNREVGNGRRLLVASLGAFTLAAAVMFGGASALADSPPAVTIAAPSSISYTSAHVSGTVNPEGGPSNAAWHFEYTTEPSNEFAWTFAFSAFGEITEGAATGTSPIPVEGTLEGLAQGTEYSVRLVAENELGANRVVTAEPYPTFTTKAVAPAAVAISAPTSVTSTSAHFSGEINPEAPAGNPSAFDVNWSFECTPGCPGLTGGTIPADNSTHAIEDAASGLEPNTEYHVSLIATNVGGSAIAGPTSFTTEPLPPRAQTLDAGSLRATSASLAARINPLNAPVTYQFEWGPDSSYGNVTPVPAKSLSAADDAFHVVTAPLTGLQPETVYHYRVVATNTQTSEVSLGADSAFTTEPAAVPASGSCPNEASRNGVSSRLPDCRVYEWVTPDSNNGALQQTQDVASADGNSFEYILTDAPDKAESASTSNVVIATRGPGGWSSQSLSPPLVSPITGFYGMQTISVSTDFSESVFGSDQPLAGSSSPSTATGPYNAYLRHADGTIVPMTKTGGFAFPGVDWATPDYKHIFFHSFGPPQLPSDPVEGNIYEFAHDELSLLGILPGEGQIPAPNGVVLAGKPSGSDSGEFILFTAIGYTNGSGESPLFLRKHGQETVNVSAAQRTTEPDPNPPAVPNAVGITANGSTVLFTSRSELTNDANTGRTEGAENDQGNDLYSYDVASGALSDLTVDGNPADATTGASVQRVYGFTRDASYIYFTAMGSLAPGALAGAENLYVEHEGSIQFIASDPAIRLLGEDLTHPEFYLTPDGRHAAFASRTSLTGYDNRNPNTGTLEAEGFKYDYGHGLVCGSCRPSGAPPTGRVAFAEGAFYYAGNGVARYLSDDGTRMFFNSNDAVLPQASNGLENAYEYSHGEVHLLSLGDGSYPAILVATSVSGDDAFIVERGELTRGSGLLAAVYDARVGGEAASSPTPECVGESCQGQAGSAPTFGAPSSTLFSGAGNVTPPPVSKKKVVKCAKGKKLSRGKCVKAKSKKKAKRAKRAKSHRVGK
jgi:hypothetical protein